MKKVITGLVVLFASATLTVSAQNDTKVKSKPTSSVTQKVHNTVSKHKKHNGHKWKKKKGDHKVVSKVKRD